MADLGGGGAWMSERKGYGERGRVDVRPHPVGRRLLIVVVLPGRPGSKWRVDAGCRDGGTISAPLSTPAAPTVTGLLLARPAARGRGCPSTGWSCRRRHRWMPRPSAADDLLMLIFTSGTSGEAEGGQVHHAKIAGRG